MVKFIAGYTSNINKEKHEVYKKKMDSLAGKGYNRAWQEGDVLGK